MGDSSPFEKPSDHEKQPYKFILDSLLERQLQHSAPETPGPELIQEITRDIVVEISVEAEAPEGTEICNSKEAHHEGYEPLALPIDKKYFRIGEVAHLVQVEPYVLRYWENEFALNRGEKHSAGHRVYGRKEVETLHYIRHLLHNEKYSIQGAKKKLKEKRSQMAQHKQFASHSPANPDWLKELAKDLKDLLHYARGAAGTF